MIEKFLKKSTQIFKKPIIVIIAATIITLFFIVGTFHLKLDNDIIHMVPANNNAKKELNKYEEIFGNSDMIFIGVESKSGIYNKDIINYIKNLTDNIKSINETLPQKNLSKLLGISKDDASMLIEIISETGLIDKTELKSILTDKDRLINEYFADEKFAESIVQKVKKVNIDKILEAYELPLKEVTSIANSDYIYGEKNKFIVKKLLPDGNISEKNIEILKKRINSWKLYKGGLVSYDEKLTAILVQLQKLGYPYRSDLYQEIRNIINKNHIPRVKVYMSGEPVIADSISKYMVNDLKVMMPLVFIILIIALYLSFKNFAGVLYPMLSVILSVIWAIGLMAYLKVPLNMVSTVLPVLLLAVGSAYGIHFMNNYFMSKETNKLKIIEKNSVGVGLAITMASLTTVAGFASLASTSLIPIRNFGIFTAIGIFFALIITLYIIPAFLLIGKREKSKINIDKKVNKAVAKILSLFYNLIMKRYKSIIIFTFIVAAIFIIGIFKIKVEMNNITFFKKSSPIRITDNILNDKLAGTSVLNIILESKNKQPIVTPKILNKIDDFQNTVQKRFKIIKKSISINDYLKKMNQEIYGGKKEYYRIPDTEAKINDYLMLYSGNLEGVITSKRDKLRITLSIKRTSTAEVEKIKKFTYGYFKDNFKKQFNLNVIITGIANIYIVVNKLITNGQISSLLLSLIVVFLINIFVFRKVLISLFSLIPISISLIINFGLMGFLKIPLNAGTAMVASLAIGIGIDYAIHFIVKYRSEIKETKDIDTAIKNTLMETGQAIFYNLFSVTAGFLVLLFSKFVPLIQFGALVSLNMITTGIGALLIIPAVFKILHQQSQRNLKNK